MRIAFRLSLKTLIEMQQLKKKFNNFPGLKFFPEQNAVLVQHLRVALSLCNQ